ncbi:hypothetical protein PUMCH_003562 [Australozyma saopauloensis]|uniref:SRP9 domain-containing protein n=1 Tax=Australozyma saopauloensis TaxID=291208 RepID=A0AAX4HCA7_9ASCO|nr:hypothetical protein PUMCH_003562 [[Candida] saopauloensis]
MDTFIDSATELLEAYPGATVSITYSNVHKKESKKVTADSKRAVNKVKFKVYDAGLSKSVRYSTTKTKELSKLLTFLGPIGVSTKRKAADEEDESAKRPKTSTGAAGIMSNYKAEELPVASAESEAVDVPKTEEVAGAKKGKKGKKGKKK